MDLKDPGNQGFVLPEAQEERKVFIHQRPTDRCLNHLQPVGGVEGEAGCRSDNQVSVIFQQAQLQVDRKSVV